MVNNSKYLIAFCLMLVTSGLWAQSNSKFSPLQRDIEITRVTLENFLKKWDGEPLLNSIQHATGAYKAGAGVEFNIEAPNSRIFLDGRIAWSSHKDKTLLDTFYDAEIVNLQKNRLKMSISKFLEDFSSYLPQIKSNEIVSFVFNVKDLPAKKTEQPDTSPNENLRTYQITFSLSGADLETIKSTEMNRNEIENSIKTATK
ncbi:hypothetical protein [uncultured Roseivirga sp.]|uniref:hypothetical protein n=1 Tax=uncultured Roseivirga sp. TaxID=543088 RepID=UPI00258443C9|nr:hypothetical protein [uncultured Roseivirga sp.]